ncbi:MAG: TonB-dependent receptor, partial [Crocinitomicaceae bacterium]|nr:TonB-dependent receptor [Crocinitomicaceae bacterium]
MSYFFRSILFLTLFLFVFNGYSQVKTYTGIIVGEGSSEPIPYVTVVLVSKESNSVLDGTTTTEDGFFQLNSSASKIYIRISYFDYKDSIIELTAPMSSLLDLGKIALKRNDAIEFGDVTVTAEKSSMEFKLDKRVFNVGKDISSTGMGAMEVLNNVPSVSVDIEGNIKLRGNSGVQILINGKPSVLSDDPANALGTITADMIESIEVITNPSAKYDAGGTSGIINIILKKDERKGFNGSISVNTG